LQRQVVLLQVAALVVLLLVVCQWHLLVSWVTSTPQH
jgi:hypothetical protein